MKSVTVDIIQNAPQGHPHRFHVKTNQQGHFSYGGIPPGAYTVNVISHGRILKTIESVTVDSGNVQSLAIQISDSGKTAALQYAQPDIVKGCIAVRNITFHNEALNPAVFGSIQNRCGRDVYVHLGVSFFGINGDMLGDELSDKLVAAGALEFRVGLSNFTLRFKPDAVHANVGRVTDVQVRFQE